jgi:hypothetical protein
MLLTSSKYQLILNERSSSSSNLLFDAVLYVSNITKSDYGVYQCKVENTLGIDTVDILLTGISKFLLILYLKISLTFFKKLYLILRIKFMRRIFLIHQY